MFSLLASFLFFMGFDCYVRLNFNLSNLFSIGSTEPGHFAFSTFRLSWTTFIMGFIHIIELIIVTIFILGSEMMLLIGKVVEVY